MEKNISWGRTKAYYAESDKLMCRDIATADSVSTLIADHAVNSVWIMGGEIYYSIYASATSVHPWKISTTGTKVKVRRFDHVSGEHPGFHAVNRSWAG